MGSNKIMKRFFILIIVSLVIGFVAALFFKSTHELSPASPTQNLQASLLLDQKRLTEIERSLQNSAADLTFLRDPQRAKIFDTYQDLILQREQLAVRYGPLHPVMAELNQKIATAHTQLQSARRAYFMGLEQEKQSLQGKISHTKRTMLQSSGSTSLATYNVDVFYSALVFLGFCFLVAMGCIVFKYYVGSVRHLSSLVAPYHVLSLVRLPQHIPARDNYVINFPASLFTENLRRVQDDITHLTKYNENTKRAVVIAGVGAQQNMAVDVAVGLARLAAKSGQRVIIIEANLRTPMMAQYLDSKTHKTLTDYLTGRAKLEECVVRDGAHQPHRLYASPIPSTAADMMAGEKMATLLASLRQMYDLCLILAADPVGFTDSRLLLAESDIGLVLIGKYERSFEAQHLAKSFQLLGRKPVMFGLVT